MAEGLKRKYGPLPLWGWALIAGGGLGLFYLYRRKKQNQPEGSEPVPEHLGIGAPLSGEAGGGGGGLGPAEALGLYKQLGEAEAKASTAGLNAANAPTAPGELTGTPVSDFVQEYNELRAAGFTVPGSGSSAAAASGNALSTARGGTPGRGGVPYRTETYRGHTAHVYSRAVPGGVGAGKNVIVLGGPAKGRQHAKPGKHTPAHTKAHKPPQRHSHPKPPRRHTIKPGRR